MKISIKIILLIVAATFFACANDDSARTYGDTVGVSNVAGQWYTEKQDNSQSDMFGEYTFTIDGAVYVDIYSKINDTCRLLYTSWYPNYPRPKRNAF